MWKLNGVEGEGKEPPLANRFSGNLTIIGGGRSVWDDLDQFSINGDVMVVNDIGCHYHQRIQHWVTLHPEYMPGWLHYRIGHCYGESVPPRTHSHKAHKDIQYHWNLPNVGGTSGLLACFIGLAMGYENIVLAGIPCDNSGHYFDKPSVKTIFKDKVIHSVWQRAKNNVFEGRVKSLSGYTRDWLGEP